MNGRPHGSEAARTIHVVWKPQAAGAVSIVVRGTDGRVQKEHRYGTAITRTMA